MKKIISLLLFISPSCAYAQFVVGAQGLTVQNGATLAVDSLVLQPSSDFTIISNQLQRAAAPVSINSGNSISRVYTFSSPISFTGTVGFYYRDTELGSNSESGLQVARSAASSGSAWIVTTGSVVNTTTNYIASVVSGSTISRVTASSATTPLPVNVLSFEAGKSDDQQTALLRWEVANEAGISRYEVERSKDGKSFERLGEVMAHKQSRYVFTDSRPMMGINYYRLQIVEEGSDHSYSQVRMVSFGNRPADLSVFPNPVVSTITIHADDVLLENMAGKVVDIAGRVVTHFTLSGGSIRLDASSWPAGSYILSLMNGQAFKIEKR